MVVLEEKSPSTSEIVKYIQIADFNGAGFKSQWNKQLIVKWWKNVFLVSLWGLKVWNNVCWRDKTGTEAPLISLLPFIFFGMLYRKQQRKKNMKLNMANLIIKQSHPPCFQGQEV